MAPTPRSLPHSPPERARIVVSALGTQGTSRAARPRVTSVAHASVVSPDWREQRRDARPAGRHVSPRHALALCTPLCASAAAHRMRNAGCACACEPRLHLPTSPRPRAGPLAEAHSWGEPPRQLLAEAHPAALWSQPSRRLLGEILPASHATLWILLGFGALIACVLILIVACVTLDCCEPHSGPVVVRRKSRKVKAGAKFATDPEVSSLLRVQRALSTVPHSSFSLLLLTPHSRCRSSAIRAALSRLPRKWRQRWNSTCAQRTWTRSRCSPRTRRARLRARPLRDSSSAMTRPTCPSITRHRAERARSRTDA